MFGAFFWCAWNIINLVVMVEICVMLILLIVDCFQKDDIDCFNVILQCGLYWNTFTVRVHIHWTIWFVCTCICLIFFKDIFKYPLIIKVPFYFAIISWHAVVFCSLSRHWYLRSQSLTSWMIHTPKVKCSKEIRLPQKMRHLYKNYLYMLKELSRHGDVLVICTHT